MTFGIFRCHSKVGEHTSHKNDRRSWNSLIQMEVIRSETTAKAARRTSLHDAKRINEKKKSIIAAYEI
jgi:hypothetical protein